MERARPSHSSGRSILAVLVATIGVTNVLLVAQAKLPAVMARVPDALRRWSVTCGPWFPWTRFTLLIVGPIVLLLFSLFISRSRYGLAIRGVADNREAAQLAGIEVRRVS